ncbi:MAG TPA: peptidylprolyl isomerase [Candidatus Baltobacteraceae bacterium]|nr:peptidylprolyl isomerase [Candidatus Baltobacteraceae bacterium]
MLKSIAASLLAGSSYVLALNGIVHLEQQRSLGNGRLAAYLRVHDRSLVQRAEVAIGRTKQPAGAALLAAHTGDADAGTRALAVYGFGLIATPAAAAPVLRALNDKTDPVLVSALDATDRLESAKVFATSQERWAASSVTRLLHAANATVRSRAATTLASFSLGAQATRAQNALQRAYGSEHNSNVREHIAWSLYRGYAKSVSVTVLKHELADKDDVVRIEAVRALGRRGDKSLVSLLKPLANDPSWRVQEQSFESVTVLNGGKMTEHLTKLANGLHLPPRTADPFANVPAQARARRRGKFSPPDPAHVLSVPQFGVSSVADLTGPQRGPHPRMRVVTTKGNIYLELFPEWAPLTVENFMNLAQGGYYDNNPWFRIVPDFVVQSGDPSANAPGVGYTTVAEENPIEQDSYIVAMGLDYTSGANAHAKRDSAGSEFYITLSPQFHLNRDFSVFGRMIAGFDVLPRLIESDRILRIERISDSPKT